MKGLFSRHSENRIREVEELMLLGRKKSWGGLGCQVRDIISPVMGCISILTLLRFLMHAKLLYIWCTHVYSVRGV
jgi:hypothetical protein